MLIDGQGRQLTYLRISVTDRCNLRCVYCMPPEGISLHEHEQILTYEEIAQIVKIAASVGIRKIRLTGGEPLVRKDLSSLVEMISKIEGIEDISLTTNGILLTEQAVGLKSAGLNRINISLDTLVSEKYERITRGGKLDTVLQGLQVAEDVGLTPIKINTVMMRGINSDELIQIALLTMAHCWQIRFLELMPIGNQAPWGNGFPEPSSIYFPFSELMTQLVNYDLVRVISDQISGPAQLYKISGSMGTIGAITPMSESFCAGCNRLRLTADGNLRVCLLSDTEIPLREALRQGEDLRPLFLQAAKIKPSGHIINTDRKAFDRCMAQIGG